METVIALYTTLERVGRPSEPSLVEQARNGSRAAFGHLYQQYVRMVHGILLARIPYSEVEDLVQDVFLLAMRRLSSLKDDKAFPGWLSSLPR